MREENRTSPAAWFASYVDGFRDAGGGLPGPLEFKFHHSYRVEENAALVAGGLGLGSEETVLARAAGLLHDAGRFPQYRRYASFMDASTIDHGAEGSRVLAEKAAGLFGDRDFKRLLCAVKYHNRKSQDLPAGLAPGELGLLRLVRDADKLDIMKTLVDSVEADGFSELPGMLPDVKLVREVTPGVLETAARGGTLSVRDLRTLSDVMLMAASWFHDLNYAPALRLAGERGYLARMRRQLPELPEAAGFFRKIEAAAAGPGRAYMEET